MSVQLDVCVVLARELYLVPLCVYCILSMKVALECTNTSLHRVRVTVSVLV